MPRDAIPRKPRASAARGRQRMRLIDACISALHIHGPSRTTVEKVVAIAKMSPGIVRFYFDSKAAMLVASLQFLASEFEELLLEPVAMLKADPVAALERLVDLYLDPEIASARKVSVWYAFWGEASSRQEYYDICGKKDDRFAALVRELIERLIQKTGQSHLDPDGIALGLIGVLEMLWQGFAFQTEVNIDRAAARHRCMAYLRSIFPGQFAPVRRRSAPRPPLPSAAVERLPRWSFASAAAFGLEKSELFSGNLQFVGDQRLAPSPGDYLALDLGAERALIVRDASGALRAFRNCCPTAPHALTGLYAGRWAGAVECRVHGHRFRYDGTSENPAAAPDLTPLALRLTDDWIWVREGTPPAAAARPAPREIEDGHGTAALAAAADGGVAATPRESRVRANWKIVVEQWLAAAADDRGSFDIQFDAERGSLAVTRLQTMAAGRWSARRYRHLMGIEPVPWRRRFLAPNQLIDRRPDGVTVSQLLPAAADLTVVRSFEYPLRDHAACARALRYLAWRLMPEHRRAGAALAESIHRAITIYGYEATTADSQGVAVAAFHRWLATRLPWLHCAEPPSEFQPTDRT